MYSTCSKETITYSNRVARRETREGCPMLIDETDTNGDTWSTYEKGPS